MKDSIRITGLVEFIDLQGNVVKIPNLIVTLGKNWISSRITGAESVASHIAVGSGANVAALGDSTLQAEFFRKALSTSGGTPSNNTVVFETTLLAGEGTGAITEVGLFDAASSGTLIARTVFAVQNKAVADITTVRWTFTIN